MTDDDKYIDLDRVLAEGEERAKPIKVRLYGRDWELPGTPPAALTVRVARWQLDGITTGELSPSHIVLLAGDLVPQATLEAWSQLGLSTDRLIDLIPHIMAKYQGVMARIMAGGTAEGEAPAPAKGASQSKTSSNGGRSSKRTSSASTKSTSTSAG